MRYNIKKEIEFIPSWEGNDKQDEPIKFYLKHLNVTERDDIFSPVADETGRVKVKLNSIKAFTIGVSKIENLTVDGKEITTPRAMLQLPGFYELMIEVATRIMTMNAFDEEAQKN